MTNNEETGSNVSAKRKSFLGEHAIGFAAIIATLSMIIAFYFQYYLHHDPCVLCIKFRAAMLSLIALYLIKKLLPGAHLVALVLNAVGVALSGFGVFIGYQLVSIENDPYTTCGGMDFDSIWSKLEEYIPLVFEAFGPCGQSPEMIFGVTMAQATLGLAALLFTLFCAALLSLRK